MATILSRLLCKVFGHKGPVKRVSKEFASMRWECPRCGEPDRAIMIGSEMPGAVVLDAELIPTRLDGRYRQPILERLAANAAKPKE
jgi:hypothetical protein